MSLPPTDEDLDRALVEAEQRAFRRRVERFGLDTLLWLALAPAWPERVAAACSFPVDLTVIGPQLAAAGLARSALVEGPSGEEERHWWMPDSARRDTLAALRRARGDALPEVTIAIAKSLSDNPAELPAVLVRWAELARSGWAADHELRHRVTGLVMRGDTGEAQAWIQAARFLASAVGGPLVTGVALAERQIELAYRREHDETLLRSFVEREEQIRWVNDLLAAPDDRWALHLLGVGGAGKTMLLRHVTSKLAPARGIVAVRIDFDHLSPDYPLRRPGQLVAALAGELRVHSTAHRQEYLFERLDSKLADLMEALGAELPPADPLANVRRPEVRLLLRMFAELVAQLPRPVLFILDTCEELAKLPVPGASAREPPAVEATFELLSGLHGMLPSARVLFAGRRFLASRGDGWEALSLAAEGTAALPPRPFLALRELRGFDEEEADRLFARMGLSLDAERRAALLARSREVAPPRVRRLDAPPGGEAAIEGEDEPPIERYHPFDLALYSSWFQEEPDLSPEKLQGEADPYVERRILGRIESAELRARVPFAVLMRRFDRAMAEAALGLPEDGDGAEGGERSLSGALRAIASQEWVDVQPDDESQGVFYEVHRALWPRLWRFYASSEERRAELAEVTRRAGPALAALARATPMSRIRGELIGAAIRALRPVEAGALWADLEQRAAEEGALGRLRAIGEGLLAEEGAGRLPPTGLLRLHVLLTCRGHREGGIPADQLAATREALDDAATERSDPTLREWLRLRFHAVDAMRTGVQGSSGSRELRLRSVAASMKGALVNALERASWSALRLLTPPPAAVEEPRDPRWTALMDWVGRDTDGPGQPTTDRVITFRSAVVRVAVAQALSLLLEDLRAVLGRYPAGLSLSGESLARWADALAARGEPADQVARVRLLAARACAMERRWAEADPLFAAAIEEGERADRSPRTPVLEGEEPPSFAVRAKLELASFDPLRLRPEASGGGAVPSLASIAAHCLALAGERSSGAPGNIASQMLSYADGDRSSMYDLLSRDASGSRLIADELLFRLARSAWWHAALDLRQEHAAGEVIEAGELHAPSILAARVLPPSFVAAARTLAAGGSPSDTIQLLDLAIDKGSRIDDAGAVLRAVEIEKLRILRRFRAEPGELAERLAHSNDENTARTARSYLRLAGRALLGVTPVDEPPDPPLHPAWRDEREQIEGVARAVVRAPGALEEGREWRTWLDGLPPRFVADIALEEGEILAVGEPARGARLLAFSYSCFTRAGDPLGALFAATARLAAEARAGLDRDALRRLWSEQVEKEYDSCVLLFDWPALATTSGLPPLADPLWRPWLERVFAWRNHLRPTPVPAADTGAPGERWHPGDGLFPTEYPALLPPPAEAPHIVSPETAAAASSLPAAPWGAVSAAPPAPPSHRESEDQPAPSSGPELYLPPERIPSRGPHGAEDDDTPPPDTGTAVIPPAAQAPSSANPAPAGTGEPAPFAGDEPRPGLFGRIRTAIQDILGVPERDLLLHPLVAPPPGDGREPRKAAAEPDGPRRKKEPSTPDSASPAEETPSFDPSRTIEVKLEMTGDELVHMHSPDSRSPGWTFPLPGATLSPAELLEDVPPEACRALEDLSRRGTVGLAIDDAPLSGVAWEALVPPRSTKPIPPAGHRHVLRLTGWRTHRAAAGKPVLRASPRWSSLFASVMHPERPRVAREGSEQAPPEGLACVVGRPFRATTGVALRISGGEDEEGPARKGMVQKAQPKGQRAREGELLRPDRHPLFGAPAVLLVPEPVESFERGVAERDQAAMMRRLAHEVARRAGIVVVLPALPARVAAELVEIAAHHLSDALWPDAARLAVDLRERILRADAEEPEHEGRAEAALEVVLYVGAPQRRSSPKK